MGKAAKKIGNVVGTGLTLGTNKIPGSPTAKFGNFAGSVVTGGLSGQNFGLGNSSGPDLGGGPGGQDPATFLAQTGGASLLANIAMGVDSQDALAGYFGKSTKDGSWQNFLGTMNQKDLDAINGVSNQLKTIQENRTLRQQAVDKVIADFPNLTKQAAKARMDAGGEFDTETKKYMEQALGQTAAKYAAGGALSSGAANEAFAKTGADLALQKLDYMGGREQTAYNMGANELNARLAEVNALRDFQNTMLTGQVQQGFSAQQANLQRQFQGQANQQQLQVQKYQSDQATKGALFGAVGGLAGTALGGYFQGLNAPRFVNPVTPKTATTTPYQTYPEYNA